MIVENATKVTKHDQQCTQPLLSKKGGLTRGEVLISKFGRYKGPLFEGGAYLRGGVSFNL